MSRSMPSPDSALKDFFKSDEIFAALFNGYFFKNETVIKAKELEPEDTAYGATIKVEGKGNTKFRTEKISKYRDNIRKTSLGYFVILGIEDQDKIHYSMPVRKIFYDVLGYSSELSALSNSQDKVEWTIDERLSKVKKGTKITPIITVVFYTGEEPWDGPQSLHDMMDIDERIKPYVPDYPLYVIDIGHDKDLSFKNKELSELKDVLSSIYAKSADENEAIVDSSTIALAGILTGDENLYFSAVESKGGKQKVCKALEETYNRIRAEKDAEFELERKAMRTEFELERKAMSTEFELERKAMGAEFELEIKAKDAEIEALKRQLAAVQG